ncbi:MAG: primase protein [Parcubacteria group bacterium GW2011_GWA1_36_12]|nr:MAG: primase protein [Parcubacteria group bacterium GW2011_GWA1_36_12]
MNEVEEIKHRIDIVDLISSYLTLKKAGANYKAICPFHNEKTPSLMISPEKQIWHCFGGCSEGGDIFTFVMKMESLEFPEALKLLADRAGVQLESRQSSDFQKSSQISKNRLYELNNLAARVFNKILISHPSGQPALEYLKKRKLTPALIKEYMLGYAPSSRAINGYLKKHGFSDLELQGAGNPDKFYKRIMFPIKDAMGNVIAFTGRVLDSEQEPKYLNTPETIIFHKSRVLYNLEKARGEIKTQKATVVVEGQMDVIASWQAGVKNVVATSGTALTSDHLQILYRYSPNIIFAFDSDSAGLTSAKKAYEMAIVEGFNVKMVDLGKFKDPGEMVAQDPKIWQSAVQKPIPVIDWYFELAFAKQKADLTSQEKKEIAKEILPLLKKIPDTIEQAHYVNLLAEKLDVSEEVIFSALKKVEEKKNSKVTAKKQPKKQNLTTAEFILAILLKWPEKIKQVSNDLSDADFKDENLLAIYKALLTEYNITKLRKDINREQLLKLDDLLLVVSSENAEMLKEDLDSVLKILKENRREDLKSYYAKEIKKAEMDKNTEQLKKLMKEFQDAISTKN